MSQQISNEEFELLGATEIIDLDAEPKDKFISKTKLVNEIINKLGEMKNLKTIAFKTIGSIKVFENDNGFKSYKTYSKKVIAILTHENKKITQPNELFENIKDLYLSLADNKNTGENIYKTDGVEFVKITSKGTFKKEDNLTNSTENIIYYNHQILTPAIKPVIKPEIKEEIKPVIKEEIKEEIKEKKTRKPK